MPPMGRIHSNRGRTNQQAKEELHLKPGRNEEKVSGQFTSLHQPVKVSLAPKGKVEKPFTISGKNEISKTFAEKNLLTLPRFKKKPDSYRDSILTGKPDFKLRPRSSQAQDNRIQKPQGKKLAITLRSVLQKGKSFIQAFVHWWTTRPAYPFVFMAFMPVRSGGRQARPAANPSQTKAGLFDKFVSTMNRWFLPISGHDMGLFKELILQQKDSPGVSQVPLRKNQEGELVTAVFERGRGFGLIVKGDATTVGVERGSQYAIFKKGQSVWLRDGDLMQINSEPVFYFDDLAKWVSPFRGNHIYPQKMPKVFSKAARLAIQSESHFVDIKFSGALKSTAQIAYSETHGWWLRLHKRERILIISEHGKKLVTGIGKETDGHAKSSNFFKIKNGDIIQFGNRVPFVVSGLPLSRVQVEQKSNGSNVNSQAKEVRGKNSQAKAKKHQQNKQKAPAAESKAKAKQKTKAEATQDQPRSKGENPRDPGPSKGPSEKKANDSGQGTNGASQKKARAKRDRSRMSPEELADWIQEFLRQQEARLGDTGTKTGAPKDTPPKNGSSQRPRGTYSPLSPEFKLLGLNQDATPREIRKAFRAKVRANHQHLNRDVDPEKADAQVRILINTYNTIRQVQGW